MRMNIPMVDTMMKTMIIKIEDKIAVFLSACLIGYWHWCNK